MGSPEISLIMAAHDPQPDWFRLAVRTSLGQTGVDHELIVVDDGSARELADVLEPLTDSRLRILRIEHGGEPAARNAGIEASRGRWLRLVDADDALPARSTSRLLALIDRSDTTVACGATRCCRSDLTPVRDLRAGLTRDPLIPYLLLRSTPMLFSMLIPRAVADAAGPWDPRFVVCHDWDYILRVFEQANAIETTEPMVYYRQHPEQASRNTEEAWRGTLLGLERFYQRHPELRSGAFECRTNAMLDYLSAELARPESPWCRRSFWRALSKDRSVIRTVRVRQAQPRLERIRMLLSTGAGAFRG